MPDAEMTGARENRWVYFFGLNAVEGDPERKDQLGGKGAGLAAMCRAGLPVPPGFTIAVDACRQFHENGGAWPDGLEGEVRSQLARLETVTGRRFGQGAQPLLVSVRSGAEVSMPGMMDTILNCGLHPGLAGQVADSERFWAAYVQFLRQFLRVVEHAAGERIEAAAMAADPEGTAENLLRLHDEATGRPFPTAPWDALRACIDAVFRSWNNERALVYRGAHGITGLHGTAVNVQTMFPSSISGIAFTRNPTRPEADEIVIESSYGLGESVVSGDVAPDRFLLNRAATAILERHIGHKATSMVGLADADSSVPSDPDASSLTDEQVTAIARMALRVEEFRGYAVDVEWGLCRGELALLQSRAIRGLEAAREVEDLRRETIEMLRARAGAGRKVWVVHNLSETLPAPTPMTWDIVRRFMRGDGGFGGMYRDLGYRPSRDVLSEGFLNLIAGRIYADPDRVAQLFWGSLPFAYDLDQIRADPSLLESAPTRFVPEKADSRFLLHAPPALWAMGRSVRLQKRARSEARSRFEEHVLPAYLRDLECYRAADLAALSSAALVEALHERKERVMTQFGKESLKPGFFGGVARAELEALLCRVLGPREGAETTRILTSGLPGDSTVEQNVCLYRVATGAMAMAEFLERYGHRAVGEMELAQPRWREDASFLEQTIRQYRASATADPETAHRANTERRRQAEAELPARLVHWGAGFLTGDVQRLAAEAGSLLPFREVGKHYLMMGYETIRAVLLELDRRFALEGHVFFLALDELADLETARDSLGAEAARRERQWKALQRLHHPAVVDSSALDDFGRPPAIEAAARLEAVCLAPGVVEGVARIVHSPAEAQQLGGGCILVCPSTDPGWTALFAVIRGLVVERGGVLSHGAITARDFGIPAVACPEATRRIADGARIRVDGAEGAVAILEEGPPA